MGSFSPSYPGVYIEELSSGQHTITGVATSIAAFIGWARRGRSTKPSWWKASRRTRPSSGVSCRECIWRTR